jgi:hypothetical protein
MITLTNQDTTPYGKAIFKSKHNVLDAQAFDDASLITALDNYPEDYLDICTRGSFHTCARGETSSAELLEAVKLGKLWLNLRHIHKTNSPIGRLVGEMHGAFTSHVGVKSKSQIGGLLISSPTATVGYHIDITDVTLWHLRGKKRIFIYPNKAPFIQPESVQAIALAAGVEKIPYQTKFEEHAQVFDLEPGDMICWPHLSPHRIDNLEGLNVSLSLESMTTASRLSMGSHFLDGFLSQKLGKRIAAENPGPVAAWTKTAASIAVRKAGLNQSFVEENKITYKINMSHKDCLEPI